MAEPQYTWKQLVIKLLCEIRDLLRHCCEQGSCRPYQPGGQEPTTSQVTLSTTAQKVLKLNPKRIAFYVDNTAGTVAARLSYRSNVTSTARALITVPAGEIKYYNAFQFPTTLGMEWYAVSASGTPTISITEEYTP
jgi:hypothetical protein